MKNSSGVGEEYREVGYLRACVRACVSGWEVEGELAAADEMQAPRAHIVEMLCRI